MKSTRFEPACRHENGKSSFQGKMQKTAFQAAVWQIIPVQTEVCKIHRRKALISVIFWLCDVYLQQAALSIPFSGMKP
jgi:hypothetical protein